MKWYNALQFIVLCLTVALVAVDWGIGLWATVTFAVVTLVKIVAEKRVGNPSLDTPMRVAVLAMVVYWLCNVLSMLYSHDLSGAADIVLRKAMLLVAPLCVLLSDMSYMKLNHLRTAFYSLLLAVVGLFVYDFCIGTFEEINHSYLALYILSVAAFIYYELEQRRCAMRLWQRLVLYAIALMTVVFLIYIDSRAGILCLYGVEVLCGLHFAIKRKWWQGLTLAVVFVGLTFTAEKTLPNHSSRMNIESLKVERGEWRMEEGRWKVDWGEEEPYDNEEEFEVPQYGKYHDARMAINVTAVKTIMGNPLFGYGVGDYDTVLFERYVQDGYEKLKNEHHNAHNQYTETALAIGVVGLIVMVLWMVMPMYIAWRRKSCLWEVMVLTFIVIFCSLFESILERQMGILFVGLLYAIMLMVINTDKQESGSDAICTV